MFKQYPRPRTGIIYPELSLTRESTCNMIRKNELCFERVVLGSRNFLEKSRSIASPNTASFVLLSSMDSVLDTLQRQLITLWSHSHRCPLLHLFAHESTFNRLNVITAIQYRHFQHKSRLTTKRQKAPLLTNKTHAQRRKLMKATTSEPSHRMIHPHPFQRHYQHTQ